MTADQRIVTALEALAAALADIGRPAMVIGGIAVIARGVPRQTVDIDATLQGAGLDLDQTVAVLARHDIHPRIDDAIEFARAHHVFLLRHSATGTPIELTVAWLPFEDEALRRAQPVNFAGVSAFVATPEDLVIYKAVAWRDRDRADIERLIVLHGPSMDFARIRRSVAEFAAALDEPERVADFDALVARARCG